jgi:hypothetical protein
MSPQEINDFIVFVMIVALALVFLFAFLAALFVVEDDVAREGADERRMIAMQWIEMNEDPDPTQRTFL